MPPGPHPHPAPPPISFYLTSTRPSGTIRAEMEGTRMPTATAILVHTLYICGSTGFLIASLISMFHLK